MRLPVALLAFALIGCGDDEQVVSAPPPPLVDAAGADASPVEGGSGTAPVPRADGSAGTADDEGSGTDDALDTPAEQMTEPVTVTLGGDPDVPATDAIVDAAADDMATVNVEDDRTDIDEAFARDAIASEMGADDVTAGTHAPPEIAPAAVALTRALESFDTLRARFLQRVEDSRGTLLREATGSLEASRPERFRWEVETPFAELLIGDGRTLWLWDPDLEQVTIRPYDERLAETPARLLSGRADELVRNFDITARSRTEQRAVYELRPLAGDGLFERLEIIFAGEAPRALVVFDSLGQRTEVLFEDVGVDVELSDDRFTFEIPEGADVLREGAVGQSIDG